LILGSGRRACSSSTGPIRCSLASIFRRAGNRAFISTERSGRVLISQDQPANEPYPERDWVWEFDGQHLRLIHHYEAYDAAEIIAIPYR
jgi:hypothetical protein